MTAIAVQGLQARVGDGTPLACVDLEVGDTETVAVLGPSGAGKSTLLRVILGLLPPDRGVVQLDGQLASAAGRVVIPPEARRLGMVFQDLALWPHLTVEGNLAFALAAQRVPRAERAGRIGTLLDRVGLASSRTRFPGELSGGERQRVAIARALVVEPRAVLLDEPLSNLDVALRMDIVALFRSLLRDQRVPTLYVTHDPREAAELADRVALLEGGRITQVGTFEEIRGAPATPFARAILSSWPAGA